jgi:hypothetical protein
MYSDDLFCHLGVRIELPAKPGIIDPKAKFSDAFHVVKETLTRIGIASKKSKTLYQTAHILHKRGQYAIFHFLELFTLDGKPSHLTEEDIARRNVIVKLLDEWKLVNVLDRKLLDSSICAPLSHLKIVSFAEKKDWKLVPKYSIGAKTSIFSET